MLVVVTRYIRNTSQCPWLLSDVCILTLCKQNLSHSLKIFLFVSESTSVEALQGACETLGLERLAPQGDHSSAWGGLSPASVLYTLHKKTEVVSELASWRCNLSSWVLDWSSRYGHPHVESNRHSQQSFSQFAAPSNLVGRLIGLGLSRFGPSSKTLESQVLLSMEVVVQIFCGYCADDDLAAVYLLQEGGEKNFICKQYAHLIQLLSNKRRLKVIMSPLSRCRCKPLSWLQ